MATVSSLIETRVDPEGHPLEYLKSLYAVRERCNEVTAFALQDKLLNFNIHMDKFTDIIDYVVSLIQVCGR